MSAATMELSADPAVVSIIPPIASAHPDTNGCTSDGATSGGEQQSKTSPGSKKKIRRRRRSRTRSGSNASVSDHAPPVPKPGVPSAENVASSSEVSHSEADEAQQQLQNRPPQRKQSNGRRSQRRRSQSKAGESVSSVPSVLQNLFDRAVSQQQSQQASQSPRSRTRSTPTPPFVRARRNSLVRNGEFVMPRADLRRLVSIENVSRIPMGRNRRGMQSADGFHPGDVSFNKPGHSNEYVSREIMDYHLRNRQTSERYNSKQIFRQALEKILIEAYPDYAVSLNLVGSTINGVGDNTSSVDICMLARPKIVSPRVPHRASISSVTSSPTPAAETNGNKPEESETVATTAAADTSTQPKEQAKKEEASPEEPNNTEQENESPNRKKKNKKKKNPAAASSSAEEKTETKEESTPAVKDEPAATEKKPEAVEVAAADSNLSSDAGAPSSPSSTNLAAFVEGEALTLESIEKLLHLKAFAKNIKMIAARVPIIKFKDVILLLDVTLNLNQDVSIRNSILVRDYAKMDWRFAPLAMVLKQWAKENHVNSAVDKSISNYSWTLMVIHYLQVVEPPVLPCLQRIEPRRYDPRQSPDQALSAWRKPPPKWRSTNKSNLRTLLRSMLHYYAYGFHYDQDVISVREGRIIKKEVVMASARDMPLQWNSFMAIEEPFNRSNTTRSVHDKEVFDKIIELLRMACTAMKAPRTSLFNIIANDLEFPITY